MKKINLFFVISHLVGLKFILFRKLLFPDEDDSWNRKISPELTRILKKT